MSKRTIFIFILFSFLMNFFLGILFTTYSVFLKEKSLNLLEMNLVNFSYMAGIVLFEIPTGAIADLWGRKRSVALGCLVMTLSFLVYFKGSSLGFFILAELIGAFGSTCINGALEAWVVDSLAHYQYQGGLDRIFRREEIKQVAILFGCLLGAFIAQSNLSLPWLFAAIGFAILSILVIVFFKEEYFQKSQIKFSLEPIKKIASESIQFGWKKRSIMGLMVFGSILALVVQPLNMYWNIYSQDNYHFSIMELGFLFAGISILGYLGSLASKGWSRYFGQEKNSIIASQLITAAAILVLGFFRLDLAPYLSFFLLHELSRGLIKPLYRNCLNQRIKSANRATVLSFDSMIKTGGSALGLIIMGLIANRFSIQAAWMVSGLILLISIPFFLGIKNGKTKANKTPLN